MAFGGQSAALLFTDSGRIHPPFRLQPTPWSRILEAAGVEPALEPWLFLRFPRKELSCRTSFQPSVLNTVHSLPCPRFTHRGVAPLGGLFRVVDPQQKARHLVRPLSHFMSSCRKSSFLISQAGKLALLQYHNPHYIASPKTHIARRYYREYIIASTILSGVPNDG